MSTAMAVRSGGTDAERHTRQFAGIGSCGQLTSSTIAPPRRSAPPRSTAFSYAAFLHPGRFRSQRFGQPLQPLVRFAGQVLLHPIARLADQLLERVELGHDGVRDELVAGAFGDDV